MGANIGTTCIYFKHKFDKNLKILAFEPDSTNYMLLKMNVALNNMSDDSILENFGLGDHESEQIMHITPSNPGHNTIIPDSEGLPTETIHIIKLDDYITKNNINPKEIKYIWIDTEGFEPQVLIGAKNLIMNNSIPIFMEFNPMTWNQSGLFEKMVTLLNDCYDYFIMISEMHNDKKNVNLYPINDLLKYKNLRVETGSMGDIFLVKDNS